MSSSSSPPLQVAHSNTHTSVQLPIEKQKKKQPYFFFHEVSQLSFFVAEKRLNVQLNPHRLRRSTCSEPHDWQREEDKRGVTLWSAYGEQPGQCAQLENMIRLKTNLAATRNERRRPSPPLPGPYTQCALGCGPALCDVTQGTSDTL